jgi:hypothetical protein
VACARAAAYKVAQTPAMSDDYILEKLTVAVNALAVGAESIQSRGSSTRRSVRWPRLRQEDFDDSEELKGLPPQTGHNGGSGALLGVAPLGTIQLVSKATSGRTLTAADIGRASFLEKAPVAGPRAFSLP